MMKCRFCPWEAPTHRKDGQPMAEKGRMDRLEQHMGKWHRAEYHAFREARYWNERAAVEKERAVRIRPGVRKPPWDLYGKKV